MTSSTNRRERGLMLVFIDPKSAETEAEFNAWFDDIHLDEVLSVAGIASGARFKRIPIARPTPSPISQQYLTLLEVEADDIEDVARRLTEAGKSMRQTDSVSTEPPPVVLWFREHTPDDYRPIPARAVDWRAWPANGVSSRCPTSTLIIPIWWNKPISSSGKTTLERSPLGV
jgi:hypothetical protein